MAEFPHPAAQLGIDPSRLAARCITRRPGGTAAGIRNTAALADRNSETRSP